MPINKRSDMARVLDIATPIVPLILFDDKSHSHMNNGNVYRHT
jgi:hypothetical protein